jgi:glycosyltransferase involved in cell wall biosynthesis
MKVMVMNSLYYPNIIGGAEKSTQVMVENLKKFGIEPVVVTISDKDKIDLVNGIKVYYIHHSNIYWSYYSKTKKNILKLLWHLLSLYNFLILKKVDKIIRLEKPDIVHTNNLAEFTIGLWNTIRKNKIPLLHTLRDYSLLCPRATMFKRKNICKRKNLICLIMLGFRKAFSNIPDAVAGNSRFILDRHLESGFFRKPLKYVVYNSLESENTVSKVKKAGRPVFGFIGHLSYHKGIEFLLDVFIKNKIGNLHVFGSGITPSYEEWLKENYKSNRIIFHGFVETLKALGSIDVLIVPSLWHEPLPRVIYEAYSEGIPVIASDRGGNPEIIDEGKTGYVYGAESEKGLIDKLKLFSSNPELVMDMKAACLKKAEDFLPGKAVRDYIDIYNDISK